MDYFAVDRCYSSAEGHNIGLSRNNLVRQREGRKGLNRTLIPLCFHMDYMVSRVDKAFDKLVDFVAGNNIAVAVRNFDKNSVFVEVFLLLQSKRKEGLKLLDEGF